MELNILPNFLSFTKRRKKLLILLTAFGISGYGAYKLYNSPSIIKKRNKLVKLIGAIFSVIELISDSTQTISLVSNDFKHFLHSDSDEIPRSLKQISKIAASDEFQHSLSRVTQALTAGILRGYTSETKNDNNNTNFSDRVLDKLFTKPGSGFASVVVGSFARNLVLGFYQNQESPSSDNDAMPGWVSVLCDDKCKEMIGDCIQTFVSTAVAVYLDKTLDINTYEELFAGLTNPKHGTKVADIMVSICNGAVETLVKTSHQVMTSSNSEMLNSKGSTSFSSDEEWFDTCKENNGWVDSVSSTLAVPRNRTFVLDLTGRVTSETVRSFLDFLLYRMLEGLRRSISVVREEVVGRGMEVFRYVGAKSAAIITFCFAFCLHLVGDSRMLMPA